MTNVKGEFPRTKLFRVEGGAGGDENVEPMLPVLLNFLDVTGKGMR
jgi:hypothetical protein